MSECLGKLLISVGSIRTAHRRLPRAATRHGVRICSSTHKGTRHGNETSHKKSETKVPRCSLLSLFSKSEPDLYFDACQFPTLRWNSAPTFDAMLKLGSYQEPVPRALEILSGIFFVKHWSSPFLFSWFARFRENKKKGNNKNQSRSHRRNTRNFFFFFS